jgi:ribosomal protein S4
MIKELKNPRKLLYKKCLNLRTNVQHKKRLLSFNFKKRKWSDYLDSLKRVSRRRKASYKLYDINKYALSRHSSFFRKRHKSILQNNQKTSFYYGGLKKKYLKNQISSVVTSKIFFFKQRFSKHVGLLSLLERRLDVVLYRSYFASSIKTARQLVQHGHVKINNHTITESSIKLKNEDRVTLNKRSKLLVYRNLEKATFWPLPPKSLIINYKIFEIVFADVLKTQSYSLSFPSFLPNFYMLLRFSKYL